MFTTQLTAVYTNDPADACTIYCHICAELKDTSGRRVKVLAATSDGFVTINLLTARPQVSVTCLSEWEGDSVAN